MTPDQIRKISFPRTEFGHPPSEVQEFFGAMLQEFVAQIAQLNINLSVGNSLKGGGGFPDGY